MKRYCKWCGHIIDDDEWDFKFCSAWCYKKGNDCKECLKSVNVRLYQYFVFAEIDVVNAQNLVLKIVHVR